MQDIARVILHNIVISPMTLSTQFWTVPQVLNSSEQRYSEQLSATQSNSVILRATQCYSAILSATQSNSVLLSVTQWYSVELRGTQRNSVVLSGYSVLNSCEEAGCWALLTVNFRYLNWAVSAVQCWVLHCLMLPSNLAVCFRRSNAPWQSR